MASLMKIHAYPLLLPLSLALLALSLPVPSLADNPLILQECHNAEAVATCVACVESDPASAEADRVGIASIVVKCARGRSSVLSANMSSLVNETSDRNLKSAFLGCSRGYAQAVRILDRVVGSYLKNGQYDDANRSIMAAADAQLSCKSSYDPSKVVLPSDMSYGMQVFAELAEAAMRIIDRF